jgi:hypothetical protein
VVAGNYTLEVTGTFLDDVAGSVAMCWADPALVPGSIVVPAQPGLALIQRAGTGLGFPVTVSRTAHFSAGDKVTVLAQDTVAAPLDFIGTKMDVTISASP